VQLQIFNQQRADQSPFRQAGLAGLNQYMQMLGLGPLPASATKPSFADQEQQYLDANPDVAASGMDAYQHYQQYGQKEGRAWPGGTTSGVGAAGYETGTPYTTGSTGTSPLGGSSSDPFAAFRNQPGYQFGLDQGTKAVQASAAARGGLNSGATLKALMKFGNDYADQQGFTPYMNRLASLAGMSQTATNQLGQAGQNYAGQVGYNLQNAGQARAGGIYGSANAWSNAGQQLGSIAGNYLGYMQKQNDFGGI
jgi:hypothetical protein